MDDGNNTTIIGVEVEFGDHTYYPHFWIADSGIWTIKGHEAMKAAMDRHDRECGCDEERHETYSDFLIWFWSTPEGLQHFGRMNRIGGHHGE